MSAELLQDLARHQAWVDHEYWKALHANDVLLEGSEIRKRMNHVLMTLRLLTSFARGETPDLSRTKDIDSAAELEAALDQADRELLDALATIDLQKMIPLPRGPQGPWEAPAGVLLLQAITHSQHHRGQNGSRMRQLGFTPPMTDFVLWYSLGRP
jgi:uncharacterized damage-inducible protein DinB